MNFKLSLIAITCVTLASCSSSYKTGQTPDDVYYSPVREVENRVEQDRYRDDYTRYDDRQLRMSVYDRRWRTMNNRYYDYYNSPYAFDYGYGYGYYGPYHGYGYNYSPYYYYNPYYSNYPVFYYPGVTVKTPVNRTPRKVNLGAYNSQTQTQSVGTKQQTRAIRNRSYNNSNNTNNRKTERYTPTRSNERPTRTYTPSNNNNNSSPRSTPSNNSGGGSVNRPSRGN